MTAVHELRKDKSGSAGGSAIEARDLRMRYGTLDVLRGVDLAVQRGEVVVLLGPNGAGKTTTIEILEGFRKPSGGEAMVLGTNPAKGDEAWRARIGVVLQSWRDHARWKVRELLDHLGRYYAPYSTPDRKRPFETDDLIKIAGLAEHADRKLSSLSGGLRRRLDVAIGIVGRPEALFLDEPTAGFDPEARRDFHDLVHRLSDMEDMAILLTTHDLDEAEKLADRILILAGGRIIANGSAEQLASQVSREAQVSWRRDGQRYVHSTADATRFVRELFVQHGEAISDLEVRRATLEDTYIALVHSQESGQAEEVVSL